MIEIMGNPNDNPKDVLEFIKRSSGTGTGKCPSGSSSYGKNESGNTGNNLEAIRKGENQ